MPYIKAAVNTPLSQIETTLPTAVDKASAVVGALTSSSPAWGDANDLVDLLDELTNITRELRLVADDIPPDVSKPGRGFEPGAPVAARPANGKGRSFEKEDLAD